MRQAFCTLCLLAAAWACPELPAAAVQAQSTSSVHVLILNSFDETTEPYAMACSIFMTELQRGFPATIVFRQFNLEERSYYGENSDELKAQLLQNQYAKESPDLVVALGPPALTFWLKHRNSIAGQAPMLTTVGEYALDQSQLRPDDAVVVVRFSFPELVENILTVAPGTSRIMVAIGSSALERRFSEMAKTQLEGYSGRIVFEYANDLSLVELERRASTLADGSAILYGVFDSDANGVRLPGNTGLAQVRAVSRVPVFGSFDEQLGLGIVGGRLIQIGRVGVELAQTAAAILNGTPPPDPVKILSMSEPVYDWRELQAWDIDVDRLPPGSVIRFQDPPPWKTYFGWVLLAATVIVAQALLVTALVLQQRRRRQAEKASANLASRLLTVHEDERRRIARELHDDLSQRMVRLSIDASYLASNPGSEAARGVLQSMQPELARLGKDIHDMSYRLHPSVVEDLGIVTALHTECERLRQHIDVAIVENFSEIRERVPKDTALGVYRIAQEALHNAVKHAAADTIVIALGKGGHMLTLTVRDNGKGFDISSAAAGHGIGLSSMRERAILAGGSLKIRSWPGHGTSVIAEIPLENAAP